MWYLKTILGNIEKVPTSYVLGLLMSCKLMLHTVSALFLKNMQSICDDQYSAHDNGAWCSQMAPPGLSAVWTRVYVHE